MVVSDGADKADDWIAEAAGPTDICLTADIPLAARCLARGAFALSFKGHPWTPDNIGSALAGRELARHLRESGAAGGGPAPMAAADRSRFLGALDAMAHAALRRAGGRAISLRPEFVRSVSGMTLRATPRADRIRNSACGYRSGGLCASARPARAAISRRRVLALRAMPMADLASQRRIGDPLPRPSPATPLARGAGQATPRATGRAVTRAPIVRYCNVRPEGPRPRSAATARQRVLECP